jgi:predicted xylose isomerase-like sugar epimerase
MNYGNLCASCSDKNAFKNELNLKTFEIMGYPGPVSLKPALSANCHEITFANHAQTFQQHSPL